MKIFLVQSSWRPVTPKKEERLILRRRCVVVAEDAGAALAMTRPTINWLVERKLYQLINLELTSTQDAFVVDCLGEANSHLNAGMLIMEEKLPID